MESNHHRTATFGKPRWEKNNTTMKRKTRTKIETGVEIESRRRWTGVETESDEDGPEWKQSRDEDGPERKVETERQFKLNYLFFQIKIFSNQDR